MCVQSGHTVPALCNVHTNHLIGTEGQTFKATFVTTMKVVIIRFPDYRQSIGCPCGQICDCCGYIGQTRDHVCESGLDRRRMGDLNVY